MYKLLLLVSLVLNFSLTKSFASDYKCKKLVNRVKSSCYLSYYAKKRIENRGTSCKQLRSSTGKTTLEVVLFNDGSLTSIKTKGTRKCSKTRFYFNGSDLEEIKVISNKMFARSDDGKLYMMYADNSIYEIMNSSGRSYSSIIDISGSGNRAIRLKFQNGRSFTLTFSKLYKRKKRRVRFSSFSNFSSLFE